MRKSSPRTAAPKSLAPSRLAAVVGGVADEQVDRSGFVDSGPSDANRVLERHELPGNQGA